MFLVGMPDMISSSIDDEEDCEDFEKDVQIAQEADHVFTTLSAGKCSDDQQIESDPTERPQLPQTLPVADR